MFKEMVIKADRKSSSENGTPLRKSKNPPKRRSIKPPKPEPSPKKPQRTPSKEEYDEASRDSIVSISSTVSNSDETLAILAAAQPEDCDYTPVARIDPAIVEFYIERQSGKKTLSEPPKSPKTEDKRPEITLLAKERTDDTEDIIHVRDYIKLIRIAVRRMTDVGEEMITIGAIDKYLQNNFWIELSGDLSDFSHQLRLALGRGVTAGLIEKTVMEGERAARIDLGPAESEGESDDESDEQFLTQPMPFCSICFGTSRYNYKGNTATEYRDI